MAKQRGGASFSGHVDPLEWSGGGKGKCSSNLECVVAAATAKNMNILKSTEQYWVC